MPTLYLRLLSAATQGEEGRQLQCEWLILEDDGSQRGGGSTDYRGLVDLVDPSADWVQNPRNVVVFVPTDRVLLLVCNVPGRSNSQIRRALPYVVEEFVATDIEAMHLAHAEIKRGEPIRVNLVETELLEEWLACLDELSLHPGYVIAEAELLPAEADAASVMFTGATVQIRTVTQAAAVDRDNLVSVLGAMPDISRITLVNGALTDIERGQLDTLEVDSARDADLGALEFLAARWRESPLAINLRQGPYAAANTEGRQIGHWRAVAALVAVWVVVALLGMISQGFWASAQADALQSRSEALYREIYPGERKIINVRRQMQRKLGARATTGGGSGFTEFLSYLAQGIDRSTTIISLNYTKTRDELAADLLVQDYDEFERMKQRLSQLGVEVVTISVEQKDDAVRARIRLKGA